MKQRAPILGTGWLVAFVFAATAVANATGTARVQQSDGTVNTYNVTIRYARNAVSITAPDRHDTLTFQHAACSFTGQLQRCLPYKISLDRNGTTHDIVFEHGTVFVNLTDTSQLLPYSSKELPPHGVLLVVRTARGTYITVKGTLDEVTR